MGLSRAARFGNLAAHMRNDTTDPGTRGPVTRGQLWLVLAVLAWTAIALFVLRHHFLDDAFIHLRYAHNLLDKGMVTYNGTLADFGTSSPAYSALLSLGSIFSRTTLLPKIVNDAVFLVVLSGAVFLFLRSHGSRRVLVGASLLLLVSPFCLRWTTDGMETGLVVLTSIVIALASFSARLPAVLMFAIGAFATLLRIEFLMLIGIGTVIQVLRYLWPRLARVGGPAAGASGRSIPWSLSMLLGGVFAIGVLYLVFGHVLPDTAIAKRPRDPHVDIAGTLRAVAYVHAASSMFGVGLLVLWLSSFALALWKVRGPALLSLLVVNAAMVVLLGGIAVTNQAIQGIRYFVFLYAFMITWNICAVGDGGLALPAWKGRVYKAAGLVLALWWAFDAYLVWNISLGRSQTYRTFASVDLSPLRDTLGIAWDIGFAGYFTDGKIHDVNGLVNGRDDARLDARDRLARYARLPLSFAFVNAEQLKELNEHLPTADWRCILSVDFPNTSLQPDRHWLLVRPDLEEALRRSTKGVEPCKPGLPG